MNYFNIFIILTTCICGSICTFIVNEKLRQGPVRASAMLSLAVALFFNQFSTVANSYLTENIPVAFLGASFIGMVSAKIVSKYRLIAFAGILFGIIYLNTSYFFKGYGGALGTAAGIALMATLSLPVFLKRSRFSNEFLVLRKWLFGNKEEDDTYIE